MKALRTLAHSLLLAAATLGAGLAHAQTLAPPSAPSTVAAGTVTNFYAGGAFYSPSSTPSVSGIATYGHLVAGTSTYALAVFTAIPGPNKTIVTNAGTGIAQKVVTLAGFDLYGLANGGIAWTGDAAGYQVGGGLSMVYKLRPYKDGFFGIIPTATVSHNNLASGAVQVGGGVQIGYFQQQQ